MEISIQLWKINPCCPGTKFPLGDARKEKVADVLHRISKMEVFQKLNARDLTEKEIQDALAEPLTATRGIVPKLIPHLSYKLKKQGGDIINTAIELNTQLKVEKLTEDFVRTLYLKNIRNAAVVIVDNKTHKIITYIGSGNFFDTTDGGQVNGAAAIRQPGSTLKPLLFVSLVHQRAKNYGTASFLKPDGAIRSLSLHLRF